ncbi:MAG: GerMN domain-containing protein [Firmicutes bacterium]|nr:GerMN domain-containing protein [Bacillota bacterium]
MRKWLVGRLIMICIFAAVLCGCTQEPEEGEAAVEGKEVIRLYYTNETATTLQEVEVLLEDHLRAQERIGEIIKKMQAPPEDMFSIIPQGVEISHSVSYNSITEKQEIRLEIDGPYESLTPNMENVFRVGLMKSLIRLENVGSVELYVNTENEQGGKESVRISYLTVDNVIVNEADANFFRDEVELTLYFINENGDKLVEEKRTTTVWISEVIAEEIMNMLIAGPQVEGHKASIPNGTVINQILL